MSCRRRPRLCNRLCMCCQLWLSSNISKMNSTLEDMDTGYALTIWIKTSVGGFEAQTRTAREAARPVPKGDIPAWEDVSLRLVVLAEVASPVRYVGVCVGRHFFTSRTSLLWENGGKMDASETRDLQRYEASTASTL